MNTVAVTGWYKVASYVLMFFASFFSLMLLFILPFAFAESALLLGVFILAGVVLYSFSSFRFMKKGLGEGYVFRGRFKDFIKVNAFVVLFFVLQSFVGITDILLKKDLLNQLVDTILSQNSESFSQLTPAQLKDLKNELISSVEIVIWVFLIYAAILTTHVIYTFRLLKKYNHLFAG
jgi:hypothetical protein